MKRYTIRASNDTAGLVVDKDDNGGWVKFTEAQARIEQLEEALRLIADQWDECETHEQALEQIESIATKALINQTNE